MDDSTLKPDIETSSDAYAARFQGKAGAYFLAVQAEGLRSLLPCIENAQALEVGGGHGQLIPVLGGLGARLTLLGSDNRCWARLRREGVPRSVRLVTGNPLDLPFADRSFDVVVAVRLLCHVERWPELLGELCRVARATVIVDYPAKQGFNRLTPLLFGVKKAIEGNTRPYTSFTCEELEDAFASEGYSVTGDYRQFLLPMALHRATSGRLRRLEQAARAIRLTTRLGSPVLLRADRLSLEAPATPATRPASSAGGCGVTGASDTCAA